MSCVYTEALGKRKVMCFWINIIKWDLWAQVELSTAHHGFSHLQNTLESVPADNKRKCKSVIRKLQHYIYIVWHPLKKRCVLYIRLCCCVCTPIHMAHVVFVWKNDNIRNSIMWHVKSDLSWSFGAFHLSVAVLPVLWWYTENVTYPECFFIGKLLPTCSTCSC